MTCDLMKRMPSGGRNVTPVAPDKPVTTEPGPGASSEAMRSSGPPGRVLHLDGVEESAVQQTMTASRSTLRVPDRVGTTIAGSATPRVSRTMPAARRDEGAALIDPGGAADQARRLSDRGALPRLDVDHRDRRSIRDEQGAAVGTPRRAACPSASSSTTDSAAIELLQARSSHRSHRPSPVRAPCRRPVVRRVTPERSGRR